MRANPVRSIRVIVVVVLVALAVSAPASAIYKTPTDCRNVYESFNWNEVKHTKMITRMVGFFEYWKGPQVYRVFDFEERQPPHGEHGEIGYQVYHAEYDPTIAVWCGPIHG